MDKAENMHEEESMEKEQFKKAQDFLGVKVLSPLEEKTVVGGIVPPESHDHTDEGRHHSHHDH